MERPNRNTKNIKILLCIFLLVSCKFNNKSFEDNEGGTDDSKVVDSLAKEQSRSPVKKMSEPENIAILSAIPHEKKSNTIKIPRTPYEFPKEDRIDVKNIKFKNDLEFNGYEYGWAYKRLDLNDNIFSVIIHPEWQTHIVNFDRNGVSISFLNTTKFSGGCIIVNKEIICKDGDGYPYNSYKKFIVKKNGEFEEIETYKPSNEKLKEDERFLYLFNKITQLDHNQEISLLPIDEVFFQDNYSGLDSFKTEKDISIFIDLFIKDKMATIDKKNKLLEILEEMGLEFVSLIPKIETKQGFTITPLHLIFPENQSGSYEALLLLCYNKEYELLDYMLHEYEEFDRSRIKYIDKKICIETEYGRENKVSYEEIFFDSKTNKFEYLSID